jgi:hypothetical protein
MFFQIAVLVLAFKASNAAHIRRGKAGKKPVKPTGFVLTQNDSQIDTNSAAGVDINMQDTSTDTGNIGQTESTTPGLSQFSVEIDEAVVIATLPTTTSLPSVSTQSLDDDISIATLPTEVVSVQLRLRCNDVSECPSAYFACLDRSEGNCFFPPCGRCVNIEEMFADTTSSTVNPQTEPILEISRIIACEVIRS